MRRSLLSAALNQTKEPAFGVDEAGHICEWNEGAADLFGYSRAEAIHRPCAELLHCEGGGYETCDLFCCVRENRDVSNRERRMTHRSGHDVIVQVSNLVCRNRPSSSFTLLHLCHDVGEEKRTERVLEQVRALAAAWDRLNKRGTMRGEIARQEEGDGLPLREDVHKQLRDRCKNRRRDAVAPSSRGRP